MFVSLAIIPLYINYFVDNTLLGIWFSISSVVNWLLMFDVGIGNGLRNNLVPFIVRKDLLSIKKYISSAYIVMGIICVLIGMFGFFLIELVEWNSVLVISDGSISASVLTSAIQIMFVSVVIQLFLKIITSILYALQKTILPNFLLLLSNSLIAIYLIFSEHNPVLVDKFYALSVVHLFCINLPLLIATIVVFATSLKGSVPNVHHFDYNASKKVLGLGYTFFIIQISLLLINSSNEFLINVFFEPKMVVEYQVYHRAFSISLTFFAVLTIPIWSAVSKAISENKWNWIKTTYNYLNIIAFILTAFFVILSFFFQEIVDFWLKGRSLKFIWSMLFYLLFTTP